MGEPCGSYCHDHQHQCTEDKNRKSDSVDDRSRYTVKLVCEILTVNAISDDLHEELPLFQQVHGKIDETDEGKVDKAIHDFEECHSSYNFIERLTDFLAAALETTASSAY